jgi:oligopeptide/dipeptide ABC transporter ATP-binding protein
MLQVNNLHSGYYSDKKYTEILKNINMHVADHEIVGVLGANGSGKTTLMKSIMGDIYASEGDVLYNGKSIYRKENYGKYRHVAIYVKQDSFNSLKPLKTVNFQIGKLYDWKSFDKEYVRLLFKELNLDPEIFNMKAIQLSDGMRHRVVIAMALLTNPELLVLDEPTTGLDSISTYNLLIMLKTIKKKASVLFSSNDVNALFQVCDRVYILYGGEIIEDGEYSSILDGPFHPYTDTLLKYVPLYSNRNREYIEINNKKYGGCVFINNCRYWTKECESQIEYRTINNHGVRCINYPGWKNDTA